MREILEATPSEHPVLLTLEYYDGPELGVLSHRLLGPMYFKCIAESRSKLFRAFEFSNFRASDSAVIAELLRLTSDPFFYVNPGDNGFSILQSMVEGAIDSVKFLAIALPSMNCGQILPIELFDTSKLGPNILDNVIFYHVHKVFKLNSENSMLL